MPDFDDDLPENWPRAGDHLFVQRDWLVDARIATYHGERLYRMKSGYKLAGDVLVGETEDIAYERSNLLWPVVFCYRHYIELALKDMIAAHGLRISPEILPNWKDHNLLLLWQSYKRLIDATLWEMTADDLPEVAAVEACIDEFVALDAGSFAFRYPVGKDGAQTSIPLDSIDLWHLRTIMDRIHVFLDATESALDAHFDLSCL
jgi:hypothetical protein